MARILVADDEEDVSVIIAERLRDDGHEVDWACDGATAVKMIETKPYDLAILDIRMPVYDGYAVCSMIKNSPKYSKISVILTSAFTVEQKQWQKGRADAFLAKPFEGSELLQQVRRLLASSGNAA